MTITKWCLAILLLCKAVGPGFAGAAPVEQHYILSVQVDAKPGEESALENWYDTVHIPEILRNLTQIKSAQRFVLAESDMRDATVKYMTIYEIETSDLAAFRRTVATISRQFDQGDALDRSTMRWTYYRQLTPRMTVNDLALATAD